MSKPKPTFLIAVQNKSREWETRSVEYSPALIRVGKEIVRFAIHEYGTDKHVLSHYATGYRVANLGPHILAHAVSMGSQATPLKPREAAERIIYRLVRERGAEAILARMTSKPIINPKRK